MAVSVPAAGPPSRALLQVVHLLAFTVLYLVVSLSLAAIIGAAMGRTVLGIWFILPFTLAFVFSYQRFVHRESLRELGLDRAAPSARLVATGFLGAGTALVAVQSAQYAAGWMRVGASSLSGQAPAAVAAGILLALALNLGIGLGEELVFRGYLLRRLALASRGSAVPVVASAFAYSGVHLGKTRDPLVLWNLFLLGIVLALAALVTRSLWSSIGLHMGWDFWGNGISFVSTAGIHPTHILLYKYHLYSQGALVAFKLVSSVVLIGAAFALVMALRRSRLARLTPEEDR